MQQLKWYNGESID